VVAALRRALAPTKEFISSCIPGVVFVTALSATWASQEEDLHVICTRSASLLHTRELRCWMAGPGPRSGIGRLRHGGVPWECYDGLDGLFP
jgi:hypothetical protein